MEQASFTQSGSIQTEIRSHGRHDASAGMGRETTHMVDYLLFLICVMATIGSVPAALFLFAVTVSMARTVLELVRE